MYHYVFVFLNVSLLVKFHFTLQAEHIIIENNTIFVTKLNFKSREQDVREYFSQFGAVAELTLPKGKKGKNSGYCFIDFQDTATSQGVLTAGNLEVRLYLLYSMRLQHWYSGKASVSHLAGTYIVLVVT